MTKKIKVLLVEDDPNLGTILSEYLNVKGYDTTLAVDGEKGYDEFIKNNKATKIGKLSDLHFYLVWRDISLWTVIEKINANRDCTLGLLMVSPAQRVGAYV